MEPTIEDFETIYSKEIKRAKINEPKRDFYSDLCHPLNFQGRRFMRTLDEALTIYDDEDTMASLLLYSHEIPEDDLFLEAIMHVNDLEFNP